MAWYAKESEQATKVTGEWRPDGKGPHDDVEVRVAYGLHHLDKVVLFLCGVELTHFSLFKKRDGWLVMLKGVGPRHPMIAWMHAKTFKEALVVVATTCDSSHVDWRIEDPPRPKGQASPL